jgi:MFS family permease
LSGTAYSITFAMALTGGMVLPYLTGVLGASYGLRPSFLVVPAALAGITALLGAAVSYTHRPLRQPGAPTT